MAEENYNLILAHDIDVDECIHCSNHQSATPRSLLLKLIVASFICSLAVNVLFAIQILFWQQNQTNDSKSEYGKE